MEKNNLNKLKRNFEEYIDKALVDYNKYLSDTYLGKCVYLKYNINDYICEHSGKITSICATYDGSDLYLRIKYTNTAGNKTGCNIFKDTKAIFFDTEEELKLYLEVNKL